MRITVIAVGKSGRGPETTLTDRYIERIAAAGRAVGIASIAVREVPDRQGADKADQEAARLVLTKPPGLLIALDEHGATLTSTAFARNLQGWCGSGRDLIFAIGGADGHGRALLEAADHTLSLSAMTFPHLLARVVLVEQIYRAVTILAGHPYHRA